MNIYLSTAYLAPVEYFAMLFGHKGKVYIEQCENYVKQTYRNRCIILSANGPMPLSVPVEGQGGRKCLIKDIQIADHGNWRHLHWNALISAYNSTPFFEYYRDDFSLFYEKQYKYLFDLNEGFRELLFDLLDIDLEVEFTNDYFLNTENGIDDISDFREVISPKKDWRIFNPDFISVPYYQVFEERYGFVENLSIVDLLFNMGNESQLILAKSKRENTI